MSTENETLSLEERLDSIWASDLLDRREDADFLQKFLLRRIQERVERNDQSSYVLNLDAEWGHGKTFFLNCFAEQLKANKFVVAKIDAWKDDHAVDPLLPVIAAIDETLTPLIKKNEEAEGKWNTIKRAGSVVAVAAAKGTFRHWLRKGMGDGADVLLDIGLSEELVDSGEAGVDEIAKLAEKKGEQLLDQFKIDREASNQFRSGLTAFIENMETVNITPPLFIIVDELDRCRPPYAIALLERIKHLFEIDNCVFIVGTHTKQLKSSIRAVYGSDFDSDRYLNRFFDRSYRFREPSISDFISFLCKKYNINNSAFRLPDNTDIDTYISKCFEFYGLGLRDCIQGFDVLRSFVTMWEYDFEIQIGMLAPLVVACQQGWLHEPLNSVIRRLSEITTQKHQLTGRDINSGYYKFMVGGSDQVNCHELFTELVSMSERRFPEFIDIRHGESQTRIWMKLNFQNELAKRRAANNKGVALEYSVIRQYWRTIRNIGRLG